MKETDEGGRWKESKPGLSEDTQRKLYHTKAKDRLPTQPHSDLNRFTTEPRDPNCHNKMKKSLPRSRRVRNQFPTPAGA